MRAVMMSSHLQSNDDGCVTGLSTTIQLSGSDAIPATNIFQVGQKWVDKDHLKSALEFYASATGWVPCNPNPSHFRCNCFRQPGHKDKYRDQQSREHDSGSLHKGCTFQIVIKSTRNKIKNKKSKPVFAAGIPIVISKLNLSHGGSCNPSSQQQLVARSRSGRYAKSINDLALCQLCTMSKNGEGRLKTSSIKSIITPFWPSNKNISKADIFNLRKRIKRIIDRDEFSGNTDNMDIESVAGTEIEHWEEEEVSTKYNTTATAPLSKKSISDIMKEIPHRYEQCNDDTKYMVGALALCMEKLTMTDGQTTLFDSSADIQEDNILSYLTSIVQNNGKSKFSTSNMFTRPDMPSEGMVRKQTKKRLMSGREHGIRSKAKKAPAPHVVVNTKEESSCGFCSEKGHRYTNCTIRKEFAGKGAEYIVSRDESQNNGEQLRNRLEHNAVLEYYNVKLGSIARNVSNKYRGVFIHNIYCQNHQQTLAGYIPLSALALEISFLSVGSRQMEIGMKERMIITGESMNTFISQASGKKVKSYIYMMVLHLKHHHIVKTCAIHLKYLVHKWDIYHKCSIQCPFSFRSHYHNHFNIIMQQMKIIRQNSTCNASKIHNENIYSKLLIQLPYGCVGEHVLSK